MFYTNYFHLRIEFVSTCKSTAKAKIHVFVLVGPPFFLFFFFFLDIVCFFPYFEGQPKGTPRCGQFKWNLWELGYTFDRMIYNGLSWLRDKTGTDTQSSPPYTVRPWASCACHSPMPYAFPCFFRSSMRSRAPAIRTWRERAVCLEESSACC